MSKTNLPPDAMTAARLRGRPQATRQLVASAARAIASIVMRRAIRQTQRQLAALDDRTLIDIGLDPASMRRPATVNWRTPTSHARIA